MPFSYDIIVRRQGNSRQWGVYGVIKNDDGSVNREELLEGGFFNKAAAHKAQFEWLDQAAANSERRVYGNPRS